MFKPPKNSDFYVPVIKIVSSILFLFDLCQELFYNNYTKKQEVLSVLYVPDDRPQWRDEYKLLTKDLLNIPGLYMMGHANFHSAFDTLDTHYHRNMEIVVVLNGKQQYIVDGKHYILYGGDIFMTYPYENHGNGNEPQEVCDFICFQFDLSTENNFLGLAPPYGEYLYRQLLNYRQRTRKAHPEDLNNLREAFYMMGSRDLRSPDHHRKLLGYSYFLQFVLNNICTGELSLPEDEYSPDIQSAMDYIHSHLLDDLTIEKAAEYCGLSLSRFKAKFRQQLGITPHAYITSLKIDTAKVLLKNPQYSVTDVAFQLNFSSSNHFSSVFKKHTGYTPTYFRNHSVSSI